MVEEITVEELATLQNEKVDFILLDVRDPEEYAERHMGGRLIPLRELPHRINELNKDQLIIAHCGGGGRSRRAVEFLMQNGFSNVKNLKGGMKAWEAFKGMGKETLC